MDHYYYSKLNLEGKRIYEKAHKDGVNKCIKYSVAIFIVISILNFIALGSSVGTSELKEIKNESYSEGYQDGFESCYNQMNEYLDDDNKIESGDLNWDYWY